MNIPAAAKKVVSAAESMGFTVQTRGFPFHKDAVLWASTKDDHVAGTVRTPAVDIDGIQVIGYRTEARLGFEVTYASGFQIAHVLDPVGRFRELHVDYSYGVKEVGEYGYNIPHAAKLTARRDAEYNDGTQYRQFEWYITAANEFYAWIDEWLMTLKSEHPPIAPKPRAPKKTKAEIAEEAAAVREATILSGGDWNAGS